MNGNAGSRVREVSRVRLTGAAEVCAAAGSGRARYSKTPHFWLAPVAGCARAGSPRVGGGAFGRLRRVCAVFCAPDGAVPRERDTGAGRSCAARARAHTAARPARPAGPAATRHPRTRVRGGEVVQRDMPSRYAHRPSRRVLATLTRRSRSASFTARGHRTSTCTNRKAPHTSCTKGATGENAPGNLEFERRSRTRGYRWICGFGRIAGAAAHHVRASRRGGH